MRRVRCAATSIGARVKSVSIVTTVLNDAAGCAVLLDSLVDQVRQPDEFIIVDAGSTDGTLEVIRSACAADRRIRLIAAPGANIGRGRNIGIEHACGEVVASTDTGCRLDAHWLECIVAPFEDQRRADFVAGVYRTDPHTLLERVIGSTTMRGALDPVCPETFNPSARSMAFTKSLWKRAGKIPDFLAIDDTLFDAKIRSMGVRWVFAGDAEVSWRPRGSFLALARQFHFYGTSAGHTQMFAEGALYNLRNLALMGMAALGTIWEPWLWALVAAAILYFFVYVHHRKSYRVMRKLRDWRAYFLALAVHWTMMLADATGYLAGSLERWWDPKRYRDGLQEYMGVGVEGRATGRKEASIPGSCA